MLERRLLGVLGDGTRAWSRLDEDHLAAHPEAAELLPRALQRIPVAPAVGESASHEIAFSESVGVMTCVPTGPDDAIVYARRRGRKAGWTRFVLGRTGVPCRTFVVRLETNEDGIVEVRTAYAGRITSPEPWTPRAHESVERWERAAAFWSKHALVWDGDVEADPAAEDTCPAYWGAP